MPSICIYVADLQRQAKSPNLGHIRRANRLLRWVRRNLNKLGVYFRRLRAPLRVVTLSDSAFKAQDYQGLVMRGCVILLAEDTPAPAGGDASLTLVPGQEVKCQVLDWYSRKHSRVVRSTYAAELLSLLDAVGQGNLIATAIDEVQRGAGSARQLLERQAVCQRAVRHEAAVDAKAVFDGITAEQPKTPAEKPLFLHALAMREYLESGHVDLLWWLDTLAMLADGMTKGSVDREALIRVCLDGIWKVVGQQPLSKQLRDDRGESSPSSSQQNVCWPTPEGLAEPDAEAMPAGTDSRLIPSVGRWGSWRSPGAPELCCREAPMTQWRRC